MARCVIPLRTSIEWFGNAASLQIEGRAKQAAVLYDEVIFEDGLFEVDITDAGSFQMWHPPESATQERLAQANRLVEPGAPVVIAFGKQAERGVPARAEDMRTMFSGSLRQRYVAELMYSVAAHIAEFNDGWATISFTGQMSPSSFDSRLPHRSTQLIWDKDFMPELRANDQWLREFAIKSFDRDAALAAALEADLHVSPLFEPVVARRVSDGLAGSAAHEVLNYMFPDVTDLPWEVIAEFRAHAASREARARLQDAVRQARGDGVAKADNMLTRDMLFADKELRRRHSLPERAGKVLASLVPFAGGALGEGTEAVADRGRDRHDWGAALGLLRP